MSKELSVFGVALLQSSASELQRESSFINACVERKAFDPVVSLSLPLEKAAEAHDEVISKSSVTVGNIVLIPTHEEE
jgi:NADPH:quinone reductase-like Zn-dependent oxidoreductase